MQDPRDHITHATGVARGLADALIAGWDPEGTAPLDVPIQLLNGAIEELAHDRDALLQAAHPVDPGDPVEKSLNEGAERAMRELAPPREPGEPMDPDAEDPR